VGIVSLMEGHMKQGFDSNNPMQIGGQAVIEGVMMRAPGMIATAVRRPNGEILVKKEPFKSLGERYSIFKLPVLRGAVGLIEMMVIGIRTLNFSAETALESEEKNKESSKKKSSSVSLGITVAFSLAVGIGIFFVTPLVATSSLFSVEQEPMAFNLVAGGIRIGLLLTYLVIISMLRDVKRLFEYHGAEHKAVFAFEKEEPLQVERASVQTRFHPRCGTSFLLIVMLVSIAVFSILDTLLLAWLGELNIVTRLLTHLPLIPLVGGVSYEFIRASAKRSGTTLGKMIIAPGLWLQKITTSEPDAAQLEVALVALRCALGEDLPANAVTHIEIAA